MSHQILLTLAFKQHNSVKKSVNIPPRFDVLT